MQTTLATQDAHANRGANRTIRVLALRAVDGAGGGADKIILRNATAVSPERVHMAVCFMHHADDDEFDLAERAARLGIENYQIKHHGPFDHRVWPQLRTLAARFQPDIVHSHDYKASFFARLLATAQATLPLATSHGWTGHKWRERALMYPADRILLRCFPGVLAVSQEIRDRLVKSGVRPARIRVVLNAVDPDDFRPDAAIRSAARKALGFTDRDIVLGAVGRVEHQKRFDLLLAAFARARKTNSRLRLVIAGDGSLLTQLRLDVERRDLIGCCQLLGHCPNMRETYQAFDMLIQSSDYEGTPTVVVEAMALGVPIVATDVGGTRQLITHGQHGLLVPRRNVDALIAGINLTLHAHESTAERVRRARQRVETTLSFRHRTSVLQQVYAELMEYRDLGLHPDHAMPA